jgi:hypothetical protein
VAANLNGDSRLDLAVANISSNTISVLLNQGTPGAALASGTFAAAVNYGVGGSPYSLVATDLNNDGKLDLAVANYGSNQVAVLLGNGDGTFQPRLKYLIAPGLGAMVLGDFNGDGFLDLAVSSTDGITVALGNGDGTFRNPMHYAAPGGAMAMGDVNGDGQPDLVMASSLDGTAMVLLNTYISGSNNTSACTLLAPSGN